MMDGCSYRKGRVQVSLFADAISSPARVRRAKVGKQWLILLGLARNSINNSMKLTVELIAGTGGCTCVLSSLSRSDSSSFTLSADSYLNPLKDRELDLRGG